MIKSSLRIAAMLALSFIWTVPVQAGSPRSRCGLPNQAAAEKAWGRRPPLKRINHVRRWVRQPKKANRFARLALDPAHGNRATANSLREAEAGLALEAWGKLPGPIRREKSGASEFVDARGQRWDVKRFNSHFPTWSGGFVLDRALDKLAGQFAQKEFVILDRTDLTTVHAQSLRQAIDARGWNDRVLWYPTTPRLVK